MSQQQSFIQLPLVGAILLCFFAILYLAMKRFAKPDPSIPITKHKVDTSSEDVLKHWTADKMRKAKPAKMPKTNDLDRGKGQPQRPPE